MNIKAAFIFLALAIAGLSSCKKSNDGLIFRVVTKLNVINAGTDTLNFYQSGTRLNNGSNLYPFGALGYLVVDAGQHNFQFKKAGSPNTLIDVPLTLTDSTNNTLFVTGQTTDRVFLLKDSIFSDANTYIRFVNASPDATGLDVTLGDSVSYKNVAFKSATQFTKITLPSGGKVLFSVYQAGSTTPLLTPGNLTLTAGGTYTLYTKGVIGGTGNNAFGARILLMQ